jgi:hypothetical protein
MLIKCDERKRHHKNSHLVWLVLSLRFWNRSRKPPYPPQMDSEIIWQLCQDPAFPLYGLLHWFSFPTQSHGCRLQQHHRVKCTAPLTLSPVHVSQNELYLYKHSTSNHSNHSLTEDISNNFGSSIAKRLCCSTALDSLPVVMLVFLSSSGFSSVQI